MQLGARLAHYFPSIIFPLRSCWIPRGFYSSVAPSPGSFFSLGSSDGFNVIMRPPAVARAISTPHQPSPEQLHYQRDGDRHSRAARLGQFRHHSVKIMTPFHFPVRPSDDLFPHFPCPFSFHPKKSQMAPPGWARSWDRLRVRQALSPGCLNGFLIALDLALS